VYTVSLQVYITKLSHWQLNVFITGGTESPTRGRVLVLLSSPLKHHVQGPPWAAGIVSQRDVATTRSEFIPDWGRIR
jgi:hypothetical protein